MEQLSFHPVIPSRLKQPSSRWKLLVVDDEIGLGESLSLLLGHLGYEVSIASSGEMALEKLRSSSFDLVVTDLVMDGVNGYDILDFINREQPDIPVLVLTGLGSIDAAVKALKQGAYDYILKPFDYDSFKISIHRALEKRRLEMIQRFQKQRIEAVASIASAVTSTLRLDEIFQIIIQQSREFIEFDSAALMLTHEEQPFVDLLTVRSDGKLTSQGNGRISLEDPLFSRVLTERTSFIVSDIGNDQELGASDFALVEDMRSCTLVPLITKDRVVGALFFASRLPFGYSQQHLEFLTPIADQVAVGVENARLLELQLRRSRQLEIINHIGKQLTSALVVDKLLEDASVLLKDYFQYKYIDIFYLDEKKTTLIRTACREDSLSDLKPANLRVDQGIVGQVARSGQTVLLNDVSQSPTYFRVFSDSWVELAVPLMAEGEIFGVLNIEDTASRKFTEDDRILIEAVASLISLAWKDAKLFEQTRKSKVYLELVLNAADDISIISVDKDGNIITFNSGSEKLLGLSAQEAKGRAISEVINGRRSRSILKTLGKKTNRGGWEEELKISRPDKKSFWAHILVRPIEPALDLSAGFLIILTDITRRVELESKLTQLTVTDDLTGLYNQRSFYKQLKREVKRAQRRNTRFSLCSFDLDRFKSYNDTYGHLAGDQVLANVGAIVLRTIRGGIDWAFRYGGDEFVLLLPDTGLTEAASLAERLRKAVIKEFKNQISISAGIGEYTPGMEDKEFVGWVDKLMYLAKRNGGDRVVSKTAKGSSHS
jgi:diguanylate cyclase (GGDEF)-like protein/PAS domain S-box-containing protein